MWCHRRLSFFLQHQWTSTVSVCLVHNLTPFFFVFCVLNIFCHIVDCTVIWDVWQRQFDSIFGAFCLYDRGLVLWKRMKWKLGENDCHSVNSLKKNFFFLNVSDCTDVCLHASQAGILRLWIQNGIQTWQCVKTAYEVQLSDAGDNQ